MSPAWMNPNEGFSHYFGTCLHANHWDFGGNYPVWSFRRSPEPNASQNLLKSFSFDTGSLSHSHSKVLDTDVNTKVIHSNLQSFKAEISRCFYMIMEKNCAGSCTLKASITSRSQCWKKILWLSLKLPTALRKPQWWSALTSTYYE